jgi:hypothetical protein
MFGKKENTPLENAIARVQSYLESQEIDSDDYAKALKHLSELHKMKEAEKPSRVSPDTMLTVGANLVGILLIIRHEHVNVISSKAMSTLMKPKP